MRPKKGRPAEKDVAFSLLDLGTSQASSNRSDTEKLAAESLLALESYAFVVQQSKDIVGEDLTTADSFCPSESLHVQINAVSVRFPEKGNANVRTQVTDVGQKSSYKDSALLIIN